MSYANAWLKWFDVIERGAAPLSTRMIELANVASAKNILDIGTGIGEPAISAALALKEGGCVSAIDHDKEMIVLARERAKARGVSNIEFIVGDIGSIEFEPYRFDAILARWSLMFVEDKVGVLSTLAKALRPGGQLVIAAWAAPNDVPALTLAKKTVHSHFDWPDTSYILPKAFALSDANATEGMFNDAGLHNISSELFPVIYEFESPESFIQYRLDVAGPLWEGMERESEEVRGAAFEAIKKAMQSYRTSDGCYRLINHAYCTAGQTNETL